MELPKNVEDLCDEGECPVCSCGPGVNQRRVAEAVAGLVAAMGVGVVRERLGVAESTYQSLILGRRKWGWVHVVAVGKMRMEAAGYRQGEFD